MAGFESHQVLKKSELSFAGNGSGEHKNQGGLDKHFSPKDQNFILNSFFITKIDIGCCR